MSHLVNGNDEFPHYYRWWCLSVVVRCIKKVDTKYKQNRLLANNGQYWFGYKRSKPEITFTLLTTPKVSLFNHVLLNNYLFFLWEHTNLLNRYSRIFKTKKNRYETNDQGNVLG